MKVHDDQLRDKDTGSPPLKYSPSVLVSTLPESWLIPPLTCVGFPYTDFRSPLAMLAHNG
jgi:hypothetical protein